MPDFGEHSVWLIPLLIFVARIFDVSLGTLRMIMVISGHRFASASLGFLEVMIWVVAVGGAVKHLDNPAAIVAFAGGFATGTLVGMTIENKLAIGFRIVRVISPQPDAPIASTLREAGYTVTTIQGQGRDGPVEIVFLTVRRKQVGDLLERIRTVMPDAILSVERAEKVSGYAIAAGGPSARLPWIRFGGVRK